MDSRLAAANKPMLDSNRMSEGIETPPAAKLFRTMQTDASGRPLCGDGNLMLGVRVPVDVKPDATGLVHPGRGGMSVTPNDPARLPPHLRPTRLDGGMSVLPVFWIQRDDLGADLSYRPDVKKPLKHGLVEPSAPVALGNFQSALTATVESWEKWV